MIEHLFSDLFKLADTHPSIAYGSLGGGCAFIMAFLRSRGSRTKDLCSRIVNALTCSMLGTSASIFCISYFELSPEMAIPIGTFMGYMGSDFLYWLVIKLVKSKMQNTFTDTPNLFNPHEDEYRSHSRDE